MMPSYRLTSPEGKKYKVTVPEGTSQEEIYSYINSLSGDQTQEEQPTEHEATKNLPEAERKKFNQVLDEAKRSNLQGAVDIGSVLAGGALDVAMLPFQGAMRIPGALTYGAGWLADSPKTKELGSQMLNSLPDWVSATESVHKTLEKLDPEVLTPKTDREKANSLATQVAASAFSPNAWSKVIKEAPATTNNLINNITGGGLRDKFMNVANAPTKGASQALSAIGAGGGAWAGQEYFPDNPLAQAGMTLAGGLTPAAAQGIGYGVKRGIGNLADASPEMYKQNIAAERPNVTDIDAYIRSTPAEDLPGMALSDISDSNRHQGLYNILGSGFLGRRIERSGQEATERLTNRMKGMGFDPNLENADLGAMVQTPLKQQLEQETALTTSLNKSPFGSLGINIAASPTQAGRAGVAGLKSIINKITNEADAARQAGVAELGTQSIDVTDAAHAIFGIPGRTEFEGAVASPLRQAASKVPAIAESMDILKASKIVDPATGATTYQMNAPTFYRWKQMVGEYLDAAQREPSFGTGATKSAMGAVKEAERTKIEPISPGIKESNKGFFAANELRREKLAPLEDLTERGAGEKLISMAQKEPEQFGSVLSKIENPLRKEQITSATHTSMGGGEGQFNPAKWAQEFTTLPPESQALLGGKDALDAANKIIERMTKLADLEKSTSKLIGEGVGQGTAADRVIANAIKNPDLHAKLMDMLPANVQESVRSGTINNMGGGAKQFNLVKFADSYFDDKNVSDATRKWIGKNDPEMIKNQRAIAQAIKNRSGTVGFAGKKETSLLNSQLGLGGLAKGLLGTGSLGVASLLTTGSFSRLMTDPQALKVMAGMSKLSDNVRSPAAAALVQEFNQIVNKYQQEESPDRTKTTITPPTPAKIQGTYEKEQEGGGAGNDKLSPDIVHAEGLRLKAYSDHLGNKTVGYGFNMDDPSARKRWAEAGLKTPFQAVKRGRLAITPQEAKQLANYSYKIAANDAKKLYPNFSKLSKNRQQALINMSYQMGLTNLSGFKDANKAIANGRFNAAVRHFAKSRWVRQTPERAKKILTMLWKDVPYDKA